MSVVNQHTNQLTCANCGHSDRRAKMRRKYDTPNLFVCLAIQECRSRATTRNLPQTVKVDTIMCVKCQRVRPVTELRLQRDNPSRGICRDLRSCTDVMAINRRGEGGKGIGDSLR